MNCMKQVLVEFHEPKKDAELTFSTCSAQTLTSLLSRLNIFFLEGDRSTFGTPQVDFQLFRWLAGEDDDTPRASSHLQAQLERFHIPFGRDGYQLYDVHANKKILSLDDAKTGNLKGGTDLILGPYGLSKRIGVVKQSCVAVELKTEEAVAQNGLESFTSQATLELIASNYHSNQMTVVLLTDLCTDASIYTLERGKENSDVVSIVVYEHLTMSQAAQFVADHLTSNCVPNRTHVLESEAPSISSSKRKDGEDVLRAFKKARVSSLDESLVWEHFQDMLHDCLPGSRDRAEVIREFYRASDFSPPAYLSMFS